jgi:hypothetical protein
MSVKMAASEPETTPSDKSSRDDLFTDQRIVARQEGAKGRANLANLKVAVSAKPFEEVAKTPRPKGAEQPEREPILESLLLHRRYQSAVPATATADI